MKPAAGAVACPSSFDEAIERVREAARAGTPLRVAARAARAAGETLLCTEQLDRLLDLDLASGTATVQAGHRLEPLEATLRTRGLTLGPRALRARRRTAGGILARDPLLSGLRQQVAGLTAVTGAGEVIEVRPVPRRAVGPDVIASLVGLSGEAVLFLGVTLRLHRLGAASAARGFCLPSLEAARAALLALRDADVSLDGIALFGPAAGEPAGAVRLRVELDGPAPVVEAELALVEEQVAAHGGSPAEPSFEPPGPAARALPVRWSELPGRVTELARLGYRAERLHVAGFTTEGADLLLPAEVDAPAPATPPPLARARAALVARLDPAGILTPLSP